MDANILYDEQTTEDALTAISSSIATSLEGRGQEYSSIISKFSKSECEHVTAMKNLLLQEQCAVAKVTDMFAEMVSMLQEASVETSQVEQNYTKNRVTD